MGVYISQSCPQSNVRTNVHRLGRGAGGEVFIHSAQTGNSGVCTSLHRGTCNSLYRVALALVLKNQFNVIVFNTLNN